MAGKTKAPHKEECMCAVCKTKRARLKAPPLGELEIIVAPPPPVEIKVRLDSLNIPTKFVYQSNEHRVKEKVEGMVVCYNLFTNDTVTLGGSIMVTPI